MSRKSNGRRAAILATALSVFAGGWAARDLIRGESDQEQETSPSGLDIRFSDPSKTAETAAPPRAEIRRSVRKFSSMQVVNPKAREFNAYITEAARVHQIDPALLRAVIETESNFSTHAVSPVGARGLMQLMPRTAADYGVRDVVVAKAKGRKAKRTKKVMSKLFDAKTNIFTGAAHLSRLAKVFGEDRPERIIAAYNAGEGAVTRYNGIPPFRETQDYVKRVTSRWGQELAASTHVAVTANAL